ncbi:microcystin degradation protein MlrC [Bradyrhizobium sp. JR1.5]|uniref:M81 family metallopeptidase n=1 Tax=unclassified Bradyrhizobium TaxID=2631580 RepID=UPI0033998286
MSRPIRIAVAHFAHETVTFLNNDTRLDDFIYPGSPAKGEALLKYDPTNFMGGFVKFAGEHQDVELVGIESPLWPKTSIASGWITEEAFETLAGKMVGQIRVDGPFDGVYLALHGAMAVRGVPRPEAELARRVREVVGGDTFISATFDLHGNEDEAFLRSADMAFTVKYFPHYDGYLQGERAARMLLRSIRGDYIPTHATLKVPIISPTVVQWTGASPWMDLVQRALIWEAREIDAYVNVFFGFPFADAPDLGMTIQVLTNGNAELAARIARDMAAAAWDQREALLTSTKVHSMSEGVRLAKQAIVMRAVPVVLADYSDRSGSATWLLKEIIAQNLTKTVIATVADRDATAALKKKCVKADDIIDIEVGGLIDESAGAPVRIEGAIVSTVEADGQFCAAIAFGGGNVLVLSDYLIQVTDPLLLSPLGLDLETFEVFAIKSRVHFRRGFCDNGLAKTVLLVEPDTPFVGTIHLDALRYEQVALTKFYPYGDPVFGSNSSKANLS